MSISSSYTPSWATQSLWREGSVLVCGNFVATSPLSFALQNYCVSVVCSLLECGGPLEIDSLLT